MRIRNPLIATADAECLIRLARLHVLMRDAYRSDPTITQLKLEGLDALRLDAVSTLTKLERSNRYDNHCPTTGTERPPTGPTSSTALPGTTGVQLAERLRTALNVLAEHESVTICRRVLLDLLFSIDVPQHHHWARRSELLISDIAGLLDLNISSTDLTRLVRSHRNIQRTLWQTTRHSGIEATPRAQGDPHEALAEAMSNAMCVRYESGLIAAIALMRSHENRGPLSIAGGALFDSLESGTQPSIDKYIGTAVARTSLTALVHHLATCEIVATDDLDVRHALPTLLRGLRADMLAAQARDDAESRALAAAARIVQEARNRLEGTPR
ncbi:Uncharacterised protein [Dermatophilus congolensis]|uniref:Uncharacterized protein n=1 Tax=Dermatophilus congolensis TaxID=1863 RepID=A0AA46BQE1_9MICO|nr:hypothetical protein [Dermatophilus congolensis]STD15413.1 Uncharacterised protein [Dermatophilus congolensis]